MAARTKRLIVLAAVLLACGAGSTALQRPAAQQPATQSTRRIVSLVPALTEMLFAIGAGPQVVGVSSYDEFPAEVKKLPKVGALLDPDTERILSLRETCRLRGIRTFPVLVDAVACSFNGQHPDVSWI